MLEKLKALVFGIQADTPETRENLPMAHTSLFELVTARGADVATSLERLRKQFRAHPVLLGTRSDVASVVELAVACEDSSEDILAQAQAIDIEEWLKSQIDAEFSENEDSVDTRGRYIEPLSQARSTLTGKPHKEIYFALVETEFAWQVPAIIKPGGWNACPGAAIHVALFKRWFDRYGAVVTTMSNDVIEFQVARPPKTIEEALALAQEHYIYCEDIVHQGVGSVSNLARLLLNRTNWYFWWD